MDWSPQQQAALRDVDQWLRDPGGAPVYRLFGYAGTGKTRLAKHLAQGVSGTTLFSAYTGKAASVLRAQGIPEAGTIHKVLYTPRDKSRERYDDLKRELEDVQQMIHEAREEYRADNEGDPTGFLVPRLLGAREAQLKVAIRLEEQEGKKPAFDLNLESPVKDAKLWVVDEVSMVDEFVAKDMLSFGVKILALGDPAQLPPVKGGGWFTDAQPNIMLTEIHRQARDNPLIAMATDVRNGKALRLGSYGDSRVIDRATPELALSADQILVGTNATREATNKRVRQLREYDSPYPMAGEKLVCLRNDKDTGLLNGTLHTTVEDAYTGDGCADLLIVPEDFPGQEPINVQAHLEGFHGSLEDVGFWQRKAYQEFTFGYALTTHKAQGSQWPHVMIIDQSHVFKGDTARRWLYTAITRAQEQVTVVRG